MKAIVFSRNKVVKIRYNDDNELPDLLKELRKIPNLKIKEKRYTG